MSVEPLSPAAPPDALIGQLFAGRYRIVREIGRGGMGLVYEALQAPFDRRVALKLLQAGGEKEPRFQKRFILEASVTARLSHPNTITMLDYGTADDGRLFIAMELLQGRTLSQAMRADGPFPASRALHIARQIARSLREAHALGVIHRDLKPANVFLLGQRDEPDFVKVLDFGLVKQVGEGDDGITHQGLFMGTPHYVAPEQARNQSPDQRADLYSLGVLLFHMLAGRPPFDADNLVDIVVKHVSEPPPSLASVRPGLLVLPELEEVVRTCLAKRPADRFQDMDQLLAALSRVSGLLGFGEPPSLPPVPRAAVSFEGGALPTPLGERAVAAAVTPAATPIPARAVLPAPAREGAPAEPAKAPRAGWRRPVFLSAAALVVVAAAFFAHRATQPAPAAAAPAQASEASVALPAGAREPSQPPAEEAAAVPAQTPAPLPVRNVPSFVLHREALAEPAPAVPSHGGSGMYKVCAGLDGAVASVAAVQGIAGGDAAIEGFIRERWRYRPQPTVVCAVVPLKLEPR